MPGTSRPKKWVWVAVALGAVVALVVSLFVTRLLAGGNSGFAAPSGLSAKANTGYVSVSWDKVSGAASYVLLRDGQVAYAGPETSYDDHVASDTPVNSLQNPGSREYSVQAVSGDGAVSPVSSPIKAMANRSWAEYSHDVGLLGGFMPPSPSTTGWEDMTCSPVVVSRDANRGSGPKGNGQPGLKFGVACTVPGDQPLSVLEWFLSSPDDLNAAWAQKATGGQPITWNNGTGVTVSKPDGNYLFLRFSDPKLSLVMISISSSAPNAISTADLLSKANTITTA
ncbi:hypothetical protein [Jongsikchunia kroppenstedtii]|uniref:hypothetical protein n=1 Tax=Jongsikchunia kroppenstedtii TaxID=1121721 RepID=UPI00037557BE|nr:hypothetical protein [Jongsikchunia kroppenstedtii]